MSFSISVNLLNFFNDHRKHARVFIGADLKTINDLKIKLKTIFKISNFNLTTNNEFLPSSEDIRILQKNEVVYAIKKIKNESKADKSTKNIKEIKQKVIQKDPSPEKNISSKEIAKKRKKSHKELSEDIASYEKQIPKKRKETIKDKTISSNKKTSVEESEDDSLDQNENKKDYSCKGNLSDYKQAVKIPTITDQYLKQKKVNIVRIDYLRGPNVEKDNTCEKSNETRENKEICELKDKELENHKPAVLNGFSIEENGTNCQTKASKTTKEIPKTKNNIFWINDDSLLEINPKPREDSPVVKRKRQMFKDFSDEIEFKIGPEIHENIEETSPPSKIISETLPDETNYDIDRKNKELNTFSTIPIIETPNNLTETKKQNVPKKNFNFNLTDISGITPFNQTLEKNPVSVHLKRKMQQGIGTLLSSLRSDESVISVESVDEDNSQFVTRRRKRVRKRRNKTNAVLDESSVTESEKTPRVFKPLNVPACPTIHIKFADDSSQIIDVKDSSVDGLDLTVREEEKIEDLADRKVFSVEDIEYAPFFTDEKARIGDLIAFKILSITSAYTPEISTYITGKVTEFEDNGDVTVEIYDGLEQCELPNGKLSIDSEERKEEISKFRQFNWKNLIDPKLLFRQV